jgi:hypothetical protein
VLFSYLQIVFHFGVCKFSIISSLVFSVKDV